VVNLLVAWLLSRGTQSLNVRAALVHVMGDLLGSVAALASGLVITFTGWTPIDPILTLLIGALILVSSLRLLRESLHGLMEGVPFGIKPEEVGQALASLEGVMSVHDLHIWQVKSGEPLLSAHLVVDDFTAWERVLEVAQERLAERFDIHHATLQPERADRLVQLRGTASASSDSPSASARDKLH
jgi:cobalt-zinc-cadmium efflux system protein